MYFEAIFQPSNGTDYNPEAADLVGRRVAVQEGWILEDGPCKGQQCYYLPNSTVGCIPVSDLQQIKSIPYVQWKAIHNQIGLDTQ